MVIETVTYLHEENLVVFVRAIGAVCLAPRDAAEDAPPPVENAVRVPQHEAIVALLLSHRTVPPVRAH